MKQELQKTMKPACNQVPRLVRTEWELQKLMNPACKQVPKLVGSKLRKLPQHEPEDPEGTRAKERRRGLRCLTVLAAYLNLLQSPPHLAGKAGAGQLSCMPELVRLCNVQVGHAAMGGEWLIPQLVMQLCWD